MIRIFALYQRNRIVLTIMITAFLAKTVANSYFLFQDLRKTTWLLSRNSGLFPEWIQLPGCMGVKAAMRPFDYYPFDYYWFLTLALEGILFALTLYNFFCHWRTSRSLGALRASRLMNIFLRDGTLFFTAISAVLLYNTVPWPKSFDVYTFVLFNFCIFSIAGSRLILSLRYEGQITRSRSHPNGTAVELSTLRFVVAARPPDGGSDTSSVRTSNISGGAVTENEVENESYRESSWEEQFDTQLEFPSDEDLESVYLEYSGGDWLAEWRTVYDDLSVVNRTTESGQTVIQV